MKTKLLLPLIAILVAALFVNSTPVSSAPRVLFIGNSYTSVNNLPRIFHDVAASAGREPSEIKAVTPGGTTLYQHSLLPARCNSLTRAIGTLSSCRHKVREAAMSGEFQNWRYYFLKGASGLYGPHQGRQPARPNHPLPDLGASRRLLARPQSRQKHRQRSRRHAGRIRKWNYKAAALKNDFLIAPVGDAWELNYENPNAIRLHASDNSHPAFNGSYLAALVIYGAIYHPPNLNVVYHGNLSHAEALYLQTIATQATQMSFDPDPEAVP